MTDGGEGLLERAAAHVLGYGMDRAVVAFSGGVDSSVVMAVAARALGPEATEAVTATSPSFPQGELEAAAFTASFLGVRHRTVETREVERDAYARNDLDRCFHCKTELYGTLRRLAAIEAGAADGAVVLAGANADDAVDFRPGLRAAADQGIRNPLLELGLGKEVVRSMARHLGLPTADKPALACLSSRVAFGIRITPDLLGRIDVAERAVRALGFDQVRVRHLGDHASIEIPRGDVQRLREHADLEHLRNELRALGWARAEIDPAGYRSGSLNPA